MNETTETPEASGAGASIVRGRDAELERIGERLADAVGGRGSLTTLTGDAGTGKSRLLGEARRMARRLSIPTLHGGATPDQELGLMTVLLRTIEPVVPAEAVAGTRGGPGERLALLDLAEATLERHALERPLLVIVDDLQWADPGSLAAIEELSKRLSALPIAWLVASRRPLLIPNADDVRIGPLSDEAVAAVLRDALGTAPGPGLLRLAGAASGNAHALVELAGGLIAEGRVRTEDGIADVVGAGLPVRVGEAMRARLDRLTPLAANVVRTAAVVGRHVDGDVLAALVPTADDLDPALQELHRAGLSRTAGPGITFPHDLLRDAILAALPAPLRREINRRTVDVLLAHGATPAQVARRLSSSATPGDTVATELLLAAVRDLASTDAATTAALARRGYELAASDDPSRTALAAEATVLLHAAHRPEEARAFARRTLDDVLSSEDRGQLLLSIAWLFDTHTDSQLQAGREALALDLSPALRARHLTRHVGVLFTAGEREGCDDLIETTRAAVTTLADPDMTYEGVIADAAHLWAHGRYTQGLQLVDDSWHLAGDDPDKLGFLSHWRADFLRMTDQVGAAEALISRRAEAARRSGQVWDEMLWEQKRGRLLTETGRPLEALATLEGLHTPGTGEPNVTDGMALGALGRAAVHTGDRGQQRVALAPLDAWLRSTTPETRREGALLLLVTALAVEDDVALTRAVDALTDTGRLELPLLFVDVCCGPLLVRAAQRLGRRDVAEQAVAWQAGLAAANPQAVSMAGALTHARAIRDGHGFKTAAAGLQDSPRPFLLAAALEDVATVDALDRALDIYTRAGARADERRVRQRLRRLGVRRAPSQPGRAGPLAALTDTESDVARLVADGLTNREVAACLYLSPHTVSTHLRHVFDKLAIRTRTELVRLVGGGPVGHGSDHGLTPSERLVAQRVADGLSNRAVAAALGISHHTVSSHLRQAYRKLGVRTRTGLATVIDGEAPDEARPVTGLGAQDLSPESTVDGDLRPQAK